jgi:hypothetical protein
MRIKCLQIKHKKMRKNVFNTLFYFSKMDKNKCPKLFLKKKFQKTGIFCFFWLIYYFIKIIKTSPKITILVLQPSKISFLYGVKASFFTPSFQKIIIPHHNCFGIDETLQKDPYHLCSWWFYTIPFKKLWKSQLFPRFFHFSLMVSSSFLQYLPLPFTIIKCEKRSSKKN